MNTLQSLRAIGLEDKQARIYLYMLEQPKSAEMTAFVIARGVDMPRSTVYLALGELELRKLVSSYKKNNVLRYLVADPKRLSRELDEKQEILGSILPTLQALSKDAAHSSSVQTFTGVEGIKIVFDDIFDNPHLKGIREYHTIAHPKLTAEIPKFFKKKMDYKKKLNIFSKIIVPEEFKANPPEEYFSNSHREARYLPGPTFEGTSIVYGKKVALFSHKDNDVYSMIIDSPAITEMLDHIFISLWNLLPPNPYKGAK